jgi:hypothetical protein
MKNNSSLISKAADSVKLSYHPEELFSFLINLKYLPSAKFKSMDDFLKLSQSARQA